MLHLQLLVLQSPTQAVVAAVCILAELLVLVGRGGAELEKRAEERLRPGPQTPAVAAVDAGQHHPQLAMVEMADRVFLFCLFQRQIILGLAPVHLQ